VCVGLANFEDEIEFVSGNKKVIEKEDFMKMEDKYSKSKDEEHDDHKKLKA